MSLNYKLPSGPPKRAFRKFESQGDFLDLRIARHKLIESGIEPFNRTGRRRTGIRTDLPFGSNEEQNRRQGRWHRRIKKRDRVTLFKPRNRFSG
jgi:hypothetical protein